MSLREMHCAHAFSLCVVVCRCASSVIEQIRSPLEFSKDMASAAGARMRPLRLNLLSLETAAESADCKSEAYVSLAMAAEQIGAVIIQPVRELSELQRAE